MEICAVMMVDDIVVDSWRLGRVLYYLRFLYCYAKGLCPMPSVRICIFSEGSNRI